MAGCSVEPRPEGYDPGAFAPIAVTVDVVLLTVVERQLMVLLIQRGKPPFEGAWALPGGFVEPDEDLAEAAARELLEETGIGVEPESLRQVGAYGHPDRDPRMRVVTVAYGATVAQLPEVPRGGSDAAHAGLVPVAEVQNGPSDAGVRSPPNRGRRRVEAVGRPRHWRAGRRGLTIGGQVASGPTG